MNQAWHLGNRVKDLQTYNTVLLAISNPNSVSAFIQRIQGGSVDHGHSVRQSAEDLHELLCSADKIRSLRNSCADPNSLVPVGDSKKAGFVSDDVRHALLKEKMMREQGLIRRSNLKMADGSFGSGFNAAEGDRRVIGAAHSLEEMLAKAAREKSRFSDEGPNITDVERTEYIHQLQRDVQREANAISATEDLLGISHTFPFETKSPYPESIQHTSHSSLLGINTATTSYPASQGNNLSSNVDLLGLNFDPHYASNTNSKPLQLNSSNVEFLSPPIMMPNSSTSASAISELDLISSTSSHQTLGPLRGLPPPPSLPPPAPPIFPSNNNKMWSTTAPQNIDALSPEQKSQYLQQLLIMNQQIINMMMQTSDKS